MWMQYPIGITLQSRHRTKRGCLDFFAVAFSPVAIVKFFHSVLSSWILGAMVVMGICGYYLLRKKRQRFATESIKIGSKLGIIASVATIFTGHLECEYGS